MQQDWTNLAWLDGEAIFYLAYCDIELELLVADKRTQQQKLHAKNFKLNLVGRQRDAKHQGATADQKKKT